VDVSINLKNTKYWVLQFQKLVTYFTFLKKTFYMKKCKLLVLTLSCVVAFNVNAQVKVKNTSKSPKLQKFCSTIQPEKRGMLLDTSDSRAMADNYYLWDNGKVITVKFIGEGGSPKLREKIKVAAKEWEKYANLTFNFIESGEANIRIRVTDNGGCNSVVGTVALGIAPEEKTMNIDTNHFYQNRICIDKYLTQTIQHEFGHAIGLLHEHSYKGKIQWNKEVVYREVKLSNGWSKEAVDFQIFKEYEGLYTNGFAYDPLSIMHYGYPANWTANNIEIKSNFKLSEMDKATVSLLYPKTTLRANEFPRFSVSNFSPTKVVKNDLRKGLLIYPSFNLTTAGRVGTIVLIAYVLDENKNTVAKQSDPTKAVCGILSGKLQPGLKASINKLNQEYEIYIPFSDFPSNLKEYSVDFRVYLIDELNNERKYLAGDIVSQKQIKQSN
jgi:predicted Zn-dependent protease